MAKRKGHGRYEAPTKSQLAAAKKKVAAALTYVEKLLKRKAKAKTHRYSK